MAENKLTGEQKGDVEQRLRAIEDDLTELEGKVEQDADILELLTALQEVSDKVGMLDNLLEDLI